MRRFLFVIAITAALALSGCISVPVAARTNTGQKFIGSADATFAGGTFNLISANGVRCYGTYNPWEQALTKTLKFCTTDGRYGVAVLTADATQKNGVGIGQANDGTTFDFCFGAAVQQIQYNW